MERLRQVLDLIGAQMRLLNASQRVAIGLCAVVIVGSLSWLMQWSVTPEMAPAVAHEFSFDELMTAEDALRAGNIPFEIRGSRIYVRPVDRHNVLRVLHSAKALPDGSLFDMHSIVTNDNPFQSPQARTFAQNYARGNELAKILATYPSVQKASVMINPSSKRRIGSPADVPTASVTVTLSPGKELSRDMVETFARLVSGAVGGLKPHNVTVANARTARSYNVPHPDKAGSSEHWRNVQTLEESFLSKIRTALGSIPGLLATVTVELDSSKRTKQTNIHDAAVPKTEFTHSTERSSSNRGTEPGTQANVGQAVGAALSGERDTSEETKVENFPPQIAEIIREEKGPTIQRVTASISIPRSFIVGVFRANHPDKEDPKDDDPDFVVVRDEQIARVHDSVVMVVQAKSRNDVQVDVYPDLQWSASGPVWGNAPEAVAMVQGGGGSDGILDMVWGYGPQAGLGILALVSMTMMLRIVRKSSELVGVSSLSDEPEVRSGDEEMLTVGPDTVGQAVTSESLLVGKEVDDESLRYAELSDEVSKLVREDTEGAASMIQRWAENMD